MPRSVMKKVLLTGGGGFIGRHCVQLLRALDAEVHVVSRRYAGNFGNVFCHSINLLEGGASRNLIEAVRPTHLLHFAWSTAPGEYWNAADNFQWVGASLELMRAFAEAGGQRVVMAGTCAEYDWDYGWCSESITPLRPRTVYGVCKRSLGEMLAAYSAEFGLSSAWGRVFFLFGPFEHPDRLVPSVILPLLRGRPAVCTDGMQVRDFLHVEDVATAFVSLLNSDVQGDINICSGMGIEVREVVKMIAVQLGRVRLLRMGEIPRSSEDPPLLVGDNRRLRAELGWSPSKAFEERLADTVEWWKVRLATGEM